MSSFLSFINDKRVRDWFYQIALILLLVGLTVFFVRNASENMVKAGIASGFDFLWRTSGIEVPFVLLAVVVVGYLRLFGRREEQA